MLQIEQRLWTPSARWNSGLPAGASPAAGPLGDLAGLVLVFGAPEALAHQGALAELAALYPKAVLFGCSTAGEILGQRVFEGALTATAVRFNHTEVRSAWIGIGETTGSLDAGSRLARALDPQGLTHVIVLSDGVHINGSDLARGLAANLPAPVTLTGGLAGDGTRFSETFVLCEGKPRREAVAVLGLYSDRLSVGFGSLGGWDPFGPERLVTRSRGNVLFELDGRSALNLYKTYLGKHAEGLPATGLLFPLSLRFPDSIGAGDVLKGVVRTILAVDEAEQSMTFAGDVPEGVYARFMKANLDRLLDGSQTAALLSLEGLDGAPELALLISCVGRKLVLKQRVEEEVEVVGEAFGGATALAGFYSYGEIAPFASGGPSVLHNQSMTITALREE